MKKIFALMLTALLFAACGDDETEPAPKPYYNPVEGTWSKYDWRGKRNVTYIFNKQNMFYFHNIGPDLEIADTSIKQKYEVKGDSIVFAKWYMTYKIDADTLWLEDDEGWVDKCIRGTKDYLK